MLDEAVLADEARVNFPRLAVEFAGILVGKIGPNFVTKNHFIRKISPPNRYAGELHFVRNPFGGEGCARTDL